MRYQDKQCLLELELPKNWQATALRDGLDSLAAIGRPGARAPSALAEGVLVHRLTPPTRVSELRLEEPPNAPARFVHARRIFNQRETQVVVTAGVEADAGRDGYVRGFDELGRHGE